VTRLEISPRFGVIDTKPDAVIALLTRIDQRVTRLETR
jgi:hypothetical protein